MAGRSLSCRAGQRADGTERHLALAAANRPPVIATPPRGGASTDLRTPPRTPPRTPLIHRSGPPTPQSASRSRRAAGGVIRTSDISVALQAAGLSEPPRAEEPAAATPPAAAPPAAERPATPDTPLFPPLPAAATAADLIYDEATGLLRYESTALRDEGAKDSPKSPMSSQGVHGGKAAQDAVAALTAQAAAAAAYGHQALVDFAAARLAALDDANSWAAACEDEDAHEA